MADRTACFYGRIIGGKVKLLNRSGFDALIKRLDGFEIDVLIRKHRKDRTLSQQGYLWGGIYQFIADHTDGWTKEDVHDAMRQMFLTDRTGPMPLLRSTTELSTVEFNEYIERIAQFCAETLELVIPEPEKMENG